MRHLATLPAEDAKTLADYLLTLKIQTQLDREPDGTVVWVRDEDQIVRARQELEQFKANTHDPRYRAAGVVADSLRQAEERLEADYRKRQRRMQEQMGSLRLRRQPVTNVLIAISLVVTLATNFGNPSSRLAQELYIAPFREENIGGERWTVWDGDPFGVGGSVRAGEVWRLITPIFIHLSVLHFLFNMMMLYPLGGAIEHRRGSLRLLLLVLVLAVFSNVGQYYLGRSSWHDGWIDIHASPTFGGMSGVLYGLFGYIWVKSRFAPELGLNMPRETVVIMVGWFFLCWLAIPGIANFAHTFGLLGGMAIGYVTTLWRRLRRG